MYLCSNMSARRAHIVPFLNFCFVLDLSSSISTFEMATGIITHSDLSHEEIGALVSEFGHYIFRFDASEFIPNDQENELFSELKTSVANFLKVVDFKKVIEKTVDDFLHHKALSSLCIGDQTLSSDLRYRYFFHFNYLSQEYFILPHSLPIPSLINMMILLSFNKSDHKSHLNSLGWSVQSRACSWFYTRR